MNKVKVKGEVYTPGEIVERMLDFIGYQGDILDKHIMDNSCGDGAFLRQIVARYIETAKKAGLCDDKIAGGLANFVHGIEIDTDAHARCLQSLNGVAAAYGLDAVGWDVVAGDAPDVSEYDGKMHYVIGNPPYVRVHNLQDSYDDVKKYRFAANGMTDLYIVFFEIGLRMLGERGRMCLITPSSYFNSVAGTVLREYISQHRRMEAIVDLGHYQPFRGITTYTAISLFENNRIFDAVRYYRYEGNAPEFIESIPYENLFVNANIVLGKTHEHDMLPDIEETYRSAFSKNVAVKNGFATLADDVFIGRFDWRGDPVIDVVKASTLEWKKCVFPYVVPGKLIDENTLKSKHADIYAYLQSHRARPGGRSLDGESDRYAFGRSQAIKDVFADKIAVGSLVKTKESVKLEPVPAGKGVYSGLYILSPLTYKETDEILRTETFLRYVRLLRKYKSGGCYTFSSKDLEKFIVYMMKVVYHILSL